MKYHIWRVFRISTAFNEKSSGHSKDICELKLLTNFDFIMTSFLGEVPNNVLNL